MKERLQQQHRKWHLKCALFSLDARVHFDKFCQFEAVQATSLSFQFVANFPLENTGPMDKLRQVNKLALETEEAKEIIFLYETLIANMDAYERATVEDWCTLISTISDQKLKQPLLRYLLVPL